MKIGVEGGRRCALEFANLGQNLGRGRDLLVWPDVSRGRRGGPLVGGICVGVDENDRKRLGAFDKQGPGGIFNCGGIDGRSHGSVGQDALVDFKSHVAFHDGREIAPEAPGARSIAPAHFEHIAKAARRDHSDARALALQKRVGADRRPVDDRRDTVD